MDLLRIKLQEELEGPHQERVKIMEAEIEKVGGRYCMYVAILLLTPSHSFSCSSPHPIKFRQLFFGVRRDYESLKAEFQQFSVDQVSR